jgi:hypothetical protein
MNQNASIKLMSMKWESNSGGGVETFHIHDAFCTRRRVRKIPRIFSECEMKHASRATLSRTSFLSGPFSISLGAIGAENRLTHVELIYSPKAFFRFHLYALKERKKEF